MAKKYFITSDVHSFFDELMVALDEKGFDVNNKDHILCICGDLFDRGNKTVELFEFVKSLQEQNRLIYVAGNHEWLIGECMKEIRSGNIPSSHHFSNQTVKSICQFCGENEWIVYDPTWRDKICEIMQPVLDFIDKNCVNYAQIGSHVLTHGWLPVIQKDNLPRYYARDRVLEYNPNWRDASQEEWDKAMWLNGMQTWNEIGSPDGLTVIVGHWNCSYGWSHIDRKYKEFPQRTHEDFQYSFQPWVKDGIIALDSCCAYTGRLNCVVIEE
jgi:hypothetical protein